MTSRISWPLIALLLLFTPSPAAGQTAVSGAQSAQPSQSTVPAASPGTSPSPSPGGAGSVQARLEWGDYDGDGLLDAYAVQSDGLARLLRNLGDGGFADATNELGLGVTPLPTSAAWSDFDGDGRLDLFLYAQGGASYLLRNDPGGFIECGGRAGLGSLVGIEQAGWIDFEGDGRPDLYLVGPEGHVFFRNVGNAMFEKVQVPLPFPAAAGTVPLVQRTASGTKAASDLAEPLEVQGEASRSAGQQSGSGGVPPGALASTTTVVTLEAFTRNAGSGAQPYCFDSLIDQAAGPCLQASSIATLGMLYPLSEKFFVEDLTGNLGAGTTTPDGRFTIGNVGPVDGVKLLAFGEQTTASGFSFNSGFSPLGLDNYVSFSSEFGISRDIMTWQASGNVGIGTTSPNAPLEVVSDSVWPLQIRGDTNPGLRIQNEGSGSSWAIYHDGDDSLNFRDSTTAATRMIIRGDTGRVGIGLPNPNSKLDVAGSISVNNSTVIDAAGNWVGGPIGTSAWSLNGSSVTYDAGVVGIGTTAPASTAKLHVSSGTSGGSPVGNAALVLESGGSHTLNMLAPSGSSQTVAFGDESIWLKGGVNYGLLPETMLLYTNQSPRLAIDGAGNVGIGVTAPSRALEISSDTSRPLLIEGNTNPGIGINNTATGSSWGLYQASNDSLSFRDTTSGFTRMAIRGDTGNVGIGTDSPQGGLSVTKASATTDPTEQGVHMGIIPYASNQDTGVSIVAANGGGAQLRFDEGPSGSSYRLWRNPGSDRLTFDGAGLDIVSVPKLEIRGGADIVEGFDTAESQVLEPGTVAVIDPQHAGALMESTEAYDSKVAGVVSGAGGVEPGLHLGQETVLDGDNQIAMAGRVYVKCSTENGAIRPGDRLTSAALRGHAMKATDAKRCDGAVLGKAMSSLDEGTGLVLVLVNLQ